MTAGTAQAGPGQRILTPTSGSVIRRSLFWVCALAFVLLVVLLSAGVAGSRTGGIALSATNPAPAGAMAVAEVLKQHGVTVVPTGSLADTRAAIVDRASTTLFIYDDGLYLDQEQLRQVITLADTVVLANPTFGELRAVAPAVAQAGAVTAQLYADCPLPAVQKSGTVSGGGSGYRVTGDPTGTTRCLGSGNGVYSLVSIDGGRLTILGATGALANEHAVEKGNAALALNLLGAKTTLVWYIPTLADVAGANSQDLGSLTPAWVTPVLLLLVLTFVIAAVWRGRRLGPLVIENLPVTVRASETMLGRARLYEKSSSRLRALDSLRIGAIGRLAVLCGLPRVATVDEVVAGVASVTGAQVGTVRSLLVDDIPQTDRDLVVLSDALTILERDVARALKP